MATRERPGDRGRRRATDALVKLGSEHRIARITAGLSLRVVANATHTSHQQIHRFEHGNLPSASIADVGAWCGVVGLDLVVRAYVGGDPVRDIGQQRLLDRLRVRLHPALRWRTEVALPVEGDRRAWDAMISGSDWRIAVEAETVLHDLQALERRLDLKRRDGAVARVLLLVADTAGIAMPWDRHPRRSSASTAAPAGS